MEPQAAVSALAGRRRSELEQPGHQERAERARRAVAERRPSFGVDGVVAEPPPEVTGRQAQLAEDPVLASAFEGGMRVGLVDLRRVCALQSGVVIDETIPDLDPGDLEALVAFTIRPPSRPAYDVQYDSGRKAWVILAPDMNLRIAGEFRTELEDGAVGLGFELRDFGSSVSVVRHRDRFVLTDGYHRATGLLARGIQVVPALVGDGDTRTLLNAAAGIRPEAFLGDRPPMLPDYWDDEVSAEVETPATTRVLLVEALDVHAWG
jgi:hypothetical protein